MGYTFVDHGNMVLDLEDDYPDFAYPAAVAVSKEPGSLGIILCSSGGGITIVANKVKGIRAVYCQDVQQAIHAREHNDANVLCLGSETVQKNEDTLAIVQAFLSAQFAGGRHTRRIGKITDIENNTFL